jgi:hypothetical protein
MGLEQQVQEGQGCEEVQRFLAKMIFWERLVDKGKRLLCRLTAFLGLGLSLVLS